MHLRTSVATLTATVLLAVPFSACASTPDAPAATPAPDAVTSHVLAISVDGLNPSALRQLGREKAPNFFRFIDDGASTLNARTEVEKTITLPNHAGMMTGRRVNARRGGHGVTWDDDRPKGRVKGASIFDVVHAAGESTALFSAKQKFRLYTRSWPDAIDRAVTTDDESVALRKALADLATGKRAFTFLHLARPDRAGHADGFMSKPYLAAVRATDRELGRVFDTIAATPALDDLVVILTSDHGGQPDTTSHSNPKLLADYTVPFLVWGDGVLQGDLYQLNPDYLDPNGSRPGYAAKRQPVRNGDVANLAAGLLGLDAVPGSQLDAQQNLEVHE